MKNVHSAILKAQQAFDPVLKDAVNPAFRSRYATLSSVLAAVEPAMFKHGLLMLGSLRSEPLDSGGIIIYVGLDIIHADSGEKVAAELGLLPAKLDPQGIGSAISYGRRYLLMTMLGLAAEDDDGNAASRQPQQQQQPAKPQPRQPQPAADVPTVSTAKAMAVEAGYEDAEAQQKLVAWATDNRTSSWAEVEPGDVQVLVKALAKKISNGGRK